MKKTIEIDRFYELLGRRCKDEVIGRFLAENNAELETDLSVGRAYIECKQLGCDVLFTSADGGSAPVSDSSVLRAHTVRLFSPTFCAGKDFQPFRSKIIGGLEFPFDQDALIRHLGPPSRTSNTVHRYDEYDVGRFALRFVRAKSDKNIAFVEIVSRQQTLHSVVERQNLLRGNTKVNWSARSEAYARLWGDVHCLYLDVELGVDVLSFKRNDCFVLVTNGASNYQMTMPNPSDCRRVELVMYVRNPEERFIQRLAQSATFPQMEKTSLGHGDTINWEIPVETGSNLTADLIIYSIVREDRELSLVIENEIMKLLWCVPISAAELEFKKTNGIGPLLAVFDKVKHPKILDPLRRSFL